MGDQTSFEATGQALWSVTILDNYVKELEKNNLEEDEESDDSQEESE